MSDSPNLRDLRGMFISRGTPAAVADAIIDAIGDAAGELAPVSQDTRDEIRDTITRHVAGLVNLVGRVKGKGVDRG